MRIFGYVLLLTVLTIISAPSHAWQYCPVVEKARYSIVHRICTLDRNTGYYYVYFGTGPDYARTACVQGVLSVQADLTKGYMARLDFYAGIVIRTAGAVIAATNLADLNNRRREIRECINEVIRLLNNVRFDIERARANLNDPRNVAAKRKLRSIINTLNSLAQTAGGINLLVTNNARASDALNVMIAYIFIIQRALQSLCPHLEQAIAQIPC